MLGSWEASKRHGCFPALGSQASGASLGFIAFQLSSLLAVWLSSYRVALPCKQLEFVLRALADFGSGKAGAEMFQ